MKKYSKIFNIFTLFASFLFMMFLSFSTAEAAYYQASENTLDNFSVHKNENKVTLNFTYQNGIKDIEVFICNPGECTGNNKALTSFAAKVDGKFIEKINTSNDKSTYTITLTKADMVGGISFDSYTDKYKDSKIDNEYEILVKAKLCIMRNLEHTGCSEWESSQTTFNGARKFDMATGLTPSTKVNTTIGQVLTIINNYVIPAMWIILGVLLITRGIILGIAIVKSSDETEIRKKKIAGLVWLAVGVFVAYAVTIAASYIMAMFGYGGYF